MTAPFPPRNETTGAGLVHTASWRETLTPARALRVLLLLLVAWISGLLGFGLSVENFGWGVLGALVLGVIAWLIGILLRPFTGSASRRR